MESTELPESVRAAARSLGVPEPPEEHLRGIADHPIARRFEELLATPPAPGSRAAGGEDPTTREGDALLRTTLLAVVGFIDRAQAVAAGHGVPLTPLADDAREAIRRVLGAGPKPKAGPKAGPKKK